MAFVVFSFIFSLPLIITVSIHRRQNIYYSDCTLVYDICDVPIFLSADQAFFLSFFYFQVTELQQIYSKLSVTARR